MNNLNFYWVSILVLYYPRLHSRGDGGDDEYVLSFSIPLITCMLSFTMIGWSVKAWKRNKQIDSTNIHQPTTINIFMKVWLNFQHLFFKQMSNISQQYPSYNY